MKRLIFAMLLSLVAMAGFCQSYYAILPVEIGKAITPEHGFLPGKKFQVYPTIEKYDFSGLRMRAELYDLRDSLNLKKIACSEVEINNQSEFRGKDGALKFTEYFQTLCSQSNIALDSASNDILTIRLEALDSRLIGFGNITAHGLCQVTMRWKDFSKSYCIDITDKSSHSPISKNAFITRKTATRVIQSASMREGIEMFFADLKTIR